MADVTPFMQRAYDYFTQQGWSPQAAAALAGNGQWESSGSSTIEDPRGEGSIGLYQWRQDRRDGLNNFAKARGLDPRSEDTQLAFANWELNNTEKSAGDQLRSAQSVDDASAAMMNYLRPAGWTSKNPQGGHAWANRLALSQAVLGNGGSAVASTDTPVPANVSALLNSNSNTTPDPYQQSVASADMPSIWQALETTGRKLIDVPQVQTEAPQIQPVQGQVHRGQGQPVSLVELVRESLSRREPGRNNSISRSVSGDRTQRGCTALKGKVDRVQPRDHRRGLTHTAGKTSHGSRDHADILQCRNRFVHERMNWVAEIVAKLADNGIRRALPDLCFLILNIPVQRGDLGIAIVGNRIEQTRLAHELRSRTGHVGIEDRMRRTGRIREHVCDTLSIVAEIVNPVLHERAGVSRLRFRRGLANAVR
jgi:hypothetical protein